MAEGERLTDFFRRADIGRVKRRCVVDTVAEKAYNVTATF